MNRGNAHRSFHEDGWSKGSNHQNLIVEIARDELRHKNPEIASNSQGTIVSHIIISCPQKMIMLVTLHDIY